MQNKNYFLFRKSKRRSVLALMNGTIRFGVMSRASKRTRKRVKEFCLIHQGLFQKVLHLLKKLLDELLCLVDMMKERWGNLSADYPTQFSCM